MTLKPTTGKQSMLGGKRLEYYSCLQASLSPQKADLRHFTQPGQSPQRSQPEGTELPRIQMTEGRREGRFYCLETQPLDTREADSKSRLKAGEPSPNF